MAERAPQLLRLAAAEPRGDHRHAQQLLLENGHAERAAQHAFERRVQALGRLAPLPPLQIRVHHFPDDRTGPDDPDLHHEIVKPLGPHARQDRLLGAALHLEHADRVRALERRVGFGVVRRQVRQIDLFAVGLVDVRERFFEHRHHARGRAGPL